MWSTASRWGAVGASVATGLLALMLAPQPARACGGLFCDRPPPNPFDPLPVAQTGENVVFAVSGTGGAATVEAHIQVFYSGPAAQFSWVVPVDAVPTVSVGTDQLFTAVSSRTQPSYFAQYLQQGTCQPEPQVGGAYDGGAFATGAGGSTGAGGAAGAGGVNVAFQGAVGPYGVAVIQSGSADALLKWLGDNGYFVGDAATSIIAQYVSEQKYFVAVRLLSGKGVNAIQPIVLKFAGSVPCVPLRLTAIAAINDLSVNLWVLGDSRAVPKNYFEINLNDARLDWLSNGSNYSALVKEAANEAGGNAFIAEYAGTSGIMNGVLWPTGISVAALQAAATPPAFLQQVVSQGLNRYGPMLSILETYIPEPQVLKDMGISEATFYNNNAFYYSQYASAFAPFDPVKAAADVDTAIVMPLMNAQALFDAHPYLTRLATFISPEEMTRDPLFIFNSDLPELSNVHRATANVMCGNKAYRYCEAPIRLDLPDGEQIWLQHPRAPAGGYCSGTYDRTDLDQMPALAVAYQQAEAGGGQRVADNTPLIASALAAHNKSLASVSARVSPDPVAGGGGGGLMSGCGCRAGGGGASAGGAAGLGALAAVLAAWRGRRRRRR